MVQLAEASFRLRDASVNLAVQGHRGLGRTAGRLSDADGKASLPLERNL